MIKKIRLLPLSIIIMSLGLGVKVVDFSFGIEAAFAENDTLSSEPEKDPQPAEESVENNAEPAVGKEASALQMNGIPTRKEIEYLQKLAKRRVELERRSKALDDREKLLEAVELRIIERTNSLKK